MINPISINNKNNYIYREQSFKSSASLSRKMLNTNYKSIDVNSADYIIYCYKYVKEMCKDMIAEVNVETERLQEIVNSKEPCIFIMNHTISQMKDIKAAKFFNTLLYREYIYHHMEKTCPRSKVLSGGGVLKHQADKGEQYQWLGVTQLKVGLKSKDAKDFNKKVIRDITDEFIKDKINLFIFPEGIFSVIPFLPLKYKFQPGCASIIKNVLDKKERVKVVPIGFAHSKNQPAIHIGEPVYFKKEGNSYSATRGNLGEEFYPNQEEITLTEKGQPVGREQVVPYISGILMENLRVCAKNAKKDAKNSKGKIFQLCISEKSI